MPHYHTVYTAKTRFFAKGFPWKGFINQLLMMPKFYFWKPLATNLFFCTTLVLCLIFFYKLLKHWRNCETAESTHSDILTGICKGLQHQRQHFLWALFRTCWYFCSSQSNQILNQSIYSLAYNLYYLNQILFMLSSVKIIKITSYIVLGMH